LMEIMSRDAVAAGFAVLDGMPQAMMMVCAQTGRVMRVNVRARERWAAGQCIEPGEFGLAAWEATSRSAAMFCAAIGSEGGDPSMRGAQALPFRVEGEPECVLCMAAPRSLPPVIAESLFDRFVLMTTLYAVCAAAHVDGAADVSGDSGGDHIAGLVTLGAEVSALKELLSRPVPTETTPRAVDMVAVANEMCDVLGPLLVDVELSVKCDTASLVIGGDVGMSRQLILALALNAFMRTRSSGGRRMVLQLDAVEPYVDLGVWDEGRPLTDQEFAAVFAEDLSAAARLARTPLDHARSLALEMGGDISLGSHEREPSMNEVRVSFPALRE
jgi:hypothetical protein